MTRFFRSTAIIKELSARLFLDSCEKERKQQVQEQVKVLDDNENITAFASAQTSMHRIYRYNSSVGFLSLL